MASFGKMDEFIPSKEKWAEYKERLSYYFVANDVEDAGKKKAMLITSIGSSNHSLLRSIVALEKLADRSYDELVGVLKDHFSPGDSAKVRILFVCQEAWGIDSYIPRQPLVGFRTL